MRKSIIAGLKVLLILLVTGLAGYVLFIYIHQHKDEEKIYIAVAGPMSGKRALNGEDMLKGVSLYLNYVNDNGGINGKHVELLEFDDKDDPYDAKLQALKIVDNPNILDRSFFQ